MVPPDVDRAWVAGLFDGEGCVSIVINPDIGGRAHHGLQCTIAMTSEETILKVQELFGGHVYYKRQLLKKPVWTWRINSIKAIPFLRSIRPFSVTKRLQIDIALEALSEWVTPASRAGALRLTDETVALREGYMLALREAKIRCL